MSNIHAPTAFYKYLEQERIKLTPLQEDLAVLILNSSQFKYLLPRGAGKTFLFDALDRFASKYWTAINDTSV